MYVCYYNNAIYCFSAWLEEGSLRPYEANKETLGKMSKTAAFREAVEAIENYIKNKEDGVRPA